jgi:hypothetical protein
VLTGLWISGARATKRAAPSLAAIALVGAAAAMSISGCQGKGVGGTCADVPGCGGDLVGSWKVDGYCQYTVNQPSTNPPLPAVETTPQTPSFADQAPQVTTGDWCQGVVIVPGDGGVTIANPIFFEPPSIFMMGTVLFNADNTYTFNLVARTTEHLTKACIQAHGATTSCAGLQAAFLAVKNSNYSDVSCADASDGCDCTLDLGDSGFESGAWSLDATKTVVFETGMHSNDGPQAASFCVGKDANGTDTLTLSGYNGATLAGGPAGLRTLTATRTSP